MKTNYLFEDDKSKYVHIKRWAAPQDSVISQPFICLVRTNALMNQATCIPLGRKLCPHCKEILAQQAKWDEKATKKPPKKRWLSDKEFKARLANKKRKKALKGAISQEDFHARVKRVKAQQIRDKPLWDS